MSNLNLQNDKMATGGDDENKSQKSLNQLFDNNLEINNTLESQTNINTSKMEKRSKKKDEASQAAKSATPYKGKDD